MTTTFDISAAKKLPARHQSKFGWFNTFEANLTDEGSEVFPTDNFPGISDEDGMMVAIFRDMDEIEQALDDKGACYHYEIRRSRHFDYAMPHEYEAFRTGQVSMKDFYEEACKDATILAELYKGAKNHNYFEA